MKIPFFRKKQSKASEPTESDKMREELHTKLDDAHERLDSVLVKLRQVRKVAMQDPAKLRLVKPA